MADGTDACGSTTSIWNQVTREALQARGSWQHPCGSCFGPGPRPAGPAVRRLFARIRARARGPGTVAPGRATQVPGRQPQERACGAAKRATSWKVPGDTRWFRPASQRSAKPTRRPTLQPSASDLSVQTVPVAPGCWEAVQIGSEARPTKRRGRLAAGTARDEQNLAAGPRRLKPPAEPARTGQKQEEHPDRGQPCITGFNSPQNRPAASGSQPKPLGWSKPAPCGRGHFWSCQRRGVRRLVPREHLQHPGACVDAGAG